MAKIKTLSENSSEPKLTTNIDSLDFVVGVPTEFTFSTIAGSKQGTMITGSSEFNEPDALEKLEYYEVKDGNWYEFSGDFGASSGFPLSDATSKFRATFNKPGAYTFTAYITSVETEEKLAECVSTATVRATDTILSTNISQLDFVVGNPVEFEFTTTAGSNQGLLIKGNSEFNEPDALEKLEYYEVNDGNWYEFSGDFGASSGFPLSDATSKFRATFNKAGAYTFTAYVYTVANNVRVAECEAIATVRAEDSQLVTNINEIDFVVGVPTEFTFSTIAGSNAGLMITGSSEFNEPDALEKLEYYEVNDGNWYEFSGDFGASSGFPLSDATSKFRATFNKAGTYTFTANIKSVNNSAIIASCETTANVREYVKAEISSTFNSSNDIKVTIPYEFTISVTPNDDTGKILNGNISFSTEEYTLEKLTNKKYVSFDGNIEDVFSASEYKFRVTFNNAENVTMKFSILNEETEYVNLEQEISVIDLVFPTATISISDTTYEEHESFDIVVSVVANDYVNKTGDYLYTFSSIDDIKSIEKYENENWIKIDKNSLNTPEEHIIKTEDLKLRVSYYNLGNYTVSFSINNQKLTEKQINIIDNIEETETAKVTREALKGGQVRDVIYNYGIENSWTQDEINSAIIKYKNDFGNFAADYGLIEKDEEQKFLNYTTHYTLVDSVIKLGVIDLKKNRDEIKDLILSTKDGVDEVLETLNNKYI